MAGASPKPRFFKTPAAFSAWLAKHHAKETELWIGYYKKASGRGGMVYKEALDEALCYGWIDGVVRSIDGETYMQRWTPRKKDSHWSLVNIRRYGELVAEGRMQATGREAFERKTAKKTARASYEMPEQQFSPAQLRQLKANRKAWEHFESMTPSYRRTVKHWVTTAKREETRQARLDRLIACGAKGQKLPQFISPPGKKD